MCFDINFARSPCYFIFYMTLPEQNCMFYEDILPHLFSWHCILYWCSHFAG